MAIAAIMKMKCVRLQPSGGGRAEVVDLEEIDDNDVAKTNIKLSPNPSPVPKAKMTIVITKAAAQGAFANGLFYRVDFTVVT